MIVFGDYVGDSDELIKAKIVNYFEMSSKVLEEYEILIAAYNEQNSYIYLLLFKDDELYEKYSYGLKHFMPELVERRHIFDRDIVGWNIYNSTFSKDDIVTIRSFIKYFTYDSERVKEQQKRRGEFFLKDLRARRRQREAKQINQSIVYKIIKELSNTNEQ